MHTFKGKHNRHTDISTRMKAHAYKQTVQKADADKQQKADSNMTH